VPRPQRLPTRNDFGPDEQPLFDEVQDAIAKKEAGAKDVRGADPRAYWGRLAWWPANALNRLEASSLIRTAGDRTDSYSHVDREWADQVLAVELRTNVVQYGHLPDALATGVRLEAIEALRSGRDEDLTETELLLTVFIRQIIGGTVTDETWTRMEEYIGARGAVEYMCFVTTLWLTFRQFNALGLPDPDDAEIDRMIDDFKTGKRAVPTDWRNRVAWAQQSSEPV
jgi:hypothetical protein